MHETLNALLACPRCDKTPLLPHDNALRCTACQADFPLLDGMPWLFAEPEASLGEWRGRMRFALLSLGHEVSRLDAELRDPALRPLTRGRLERYKSALEQHSRALQDLMQALDIQNPGGEYHTYLALRTRLPVDQGLNTYYANVHRDWCWGDDENQASIRQLRSVLGDNTTLGKVLVLGAGAGRLAYDLHRQLDCSLTVALDFNPLLLKVASTVTRGGELQLHEFPIAPRTLEDDVVLRTLSAPEPVGENFHLVLGDALRPPFASATFDTVVTPWLIDIINQDLGSLGARINNLLRDRGRWLNFGSLAFGGPLRARHYSAEETLEIVSDCGFSTALVAEATIPYMCSPASRHGRQETVFTFSAQKQRKVAARERHRALPDWIVTGKEPVPLSASFRSQAMSTQIYAFIMSLIDGRRTIPDMAEVLEQRKLMSRAEAEPAIRSFLTRMYDDAQKSSAL
ncbi:MAG: hypothetical protein OEW64_07755 [Gammaproteobacteria bacterium]|nr:hypothetical protein [Gammaproteobacteria bacterium]MDH5303977.1 hypothetical protein [Gammaproteobacteria bacterium]MDH5321738.1 hypothetical protein [Gammaproteobacteria bacterium]